MDPKKLKKKKKKGTPNKDSLRGLTAAPKNYKDAKGIGHPKKWSWKK